MAETAPSNNRHKYNQTFLKELDRLNASQQLAVEQIEGPVLVIAGPGTGKTHILTARIGRILMETDAKAANILCLTFTDAGVHAMRERLLEFIGPEAHRVHIYTFHSFCNTIIQENLEKFGRHELEPLTDLERIELIRKLIDQLPPTHLLKRKSHDLYFYEAHLYDLFKRMKSEAWSVEYIENKIKEYLADLPNRKEYIYQRKYKAFKKGDLKQWKIDEAKDRMEQLLSAVALYPRYIQLMDFTKRYDFDDMILWVLKAFEENQALLRTYQERYLYFLVDEYQDTNGSQNQIIQKLIEYWSNPNIFIVGDDDQSIYEFQGARLKNLLDFHNDFKEDLTLVMLKENYRSSQNILDSSRAVIDHNQNRIVRNLKGIEKILVAQHQDFAASPIRPQIVSYENRAQEEADLVYQIEALYQKGFPLEDVAIIYARHRQARNIITLLEKKNIPYNTKRQVNILDLPQIQNLRLFLEYINLEFQRPYSGEHLLYQILHFDFLAIPGDDLAKISFYLAKHQKVDRKYWRELIADEVALMSIGLSKPKAFKHISELLNALVKDYRNFTLPQLIERVFNRSGLLNYMLQQADRKWQLQILSTFFNFIQKETDKSPRLQLHKLLETFNNIDTNRLSIGIQKVMHAKDGVNLVTAHSSKGLEFQQVYMLDCTKDQWEPAKSASSKRFSFPDTLTFSGEEDAMEARRRLFYVAMTRAKEFLHISFSAKDYKGKSLQKATYVDELLEESDLSVTQQEVEEETLLDSRLLLLLETEKPKIPAESKEEVDALLEGFSLSVTSLNSYLRCPLSFYFENILRIPYVQSNAASYGIAMHHAFHYYFEKLKKPNPEKEVGLEDLQFFFRDEMWRQRGYFTKKDYTHRLETGQQHLEGYYHQHSSTWSKNTLLEYNVRNVELDGVPIVGTIDRIDIAKDGRSVHLVDYKTGRQDNSKMRKFTEANPTGGLYRRQLIFYKLLYESHQSEHLVRSAEISYLEPDNKRTFPVKKLDYKIEEVEIVRQLIKTSYQKIKNHEFYEGCGEKDCKWCNFVKNNKIVDSFVDVEAEDLDDR